MSPFGFLVAAPDTNPDAVDRLAGRMRDAIAPGGFLALVWRLDGWLPQASRLEAQCIAAFVDRQGWAFFGNLAIRGYGQDRQVPAETWFVLLLRKPGPRLLDAVKALPPRAREEARLDTKAPAFTRDWANNVWHMPQDRLLGRVVGRLAALLNLPGEPMLLEGVDAGAVSVPVAAEEFVPRIEKVPYRVDAAATGIAADSPAGPKKRGRPPGTKAPAGPLPLFAAAGARRNTD